MKIYTLVVIGRNKCNCYGFHWRILTQYTFKVCLGVKRKVSKIGENDLAFENAYSRRLIKFVGKQRGYTI